jgi:hypothetical protein
VGEEGGGGVSGGRDEGFDTVTGEQRWRE